MGEVVTSRDPERAREYSRQWEAANKERRREYHREYYAANAEKKREYARQYRQEDPDRWREIKKRARRKNPQPTRDHARRWREKNPERYREKQNQNKRKMRAAGYREPRTLERDRVIAAHWHSQEGRCYLCSEPLLLEEAILEHDHRCCPNAKWCSHCVRGAAHPACNAAIGMALDDPDRLETIARNLRAKLAEMDDRLAAKPQQLTLDDVA
jgi:recombination endonuclease VII